MSVQLLIEQEFRSRLDEIVSRAEPLEKWRFLLPNTHFAPPACEARKMYRMGYFYGCICVSQATAEALARFIARRKEMAEKYWVERDGQHGGVHHRKRLNDMRQQKVLSAKAFKHFLRILNNKRNSFHHMNEDVPQVTQDLQQMAMECVESLYSIEGAFLGLAQDGSVVVHDRELWDVKEDGSVTVYVDLVRI